LEINSLVSDCKSRRLLPFHETNPEVFLWESLKSLIQVTVHVPQLRCQLGTRRPSNC